MSYQYLKGDLEIPIASGAASVTDVYVNSRAMNIVYDVINAGGSSVTLFSCNVPKRKVDDDLYAIPDAEMGAVGSAITTSVFNQTISVAPNWLRIKSNGTGAVTIRLRANGFGQ